MTQRKAEHRRRLSLLPPFVALVLAVLLLATLLLATACDGGSGLLSSIRGSGDLETRDYDLAGFNGLDISSAFVVTVTQSDTYSVSVTADDNILGLIQVEKADRTLKIGLGNTRVTNVTLRATITMPTLSALYVSGATQATVSGFSSKDPLALEASGASAITGDITAGVAGFNVSGASRVELQGTAAELVAEVSGASHLLLRDFAVTHADVDVSGASEATVNLSGRLDAEVSGASKLRYLGKPTMGSINTSGASSISAD